MVAISFTFIGVFCLVFVLWSLHEFGHWLAARLLGYRATLSIERWFFASMSVTVFAKEYLPSWHDMTITLAGVIFQLTGAVLLMTLLNYLLYLSFSPLFYTPIILRQLLPIQALASDGYYFVAALPNMSLRTLFSFLFIVGYLLCWLAILHTLFVYETTIYNILLVLLSLFFNADLIIFPLKQKNLV